MEIKVLCHCGVKYKFDVEPVEGRMPFTVKCPSCATEATEFANAHIRRSLGISATPPVPVAAVPAGAAAGPVAASPVAPTVPKLRVAGHAPVGLSVPAAETSGAPPEPPPVPPVRVPLAPSAAPAKPKKPPSFGLGLVGALLGAVVGVGIWLLVHQFIGAKSKFLILGVGFFAGFGARFLSRDEGSQQLGMIAAALTLTGVFGVQYFIAYQDMFGEDLTAEIAEELKLEVAEAKKILAQMPNESDDEIRTYLASSDEDEDEGEKIDPRSITAEDIKLFREETLPFYKGLANGGVLIEDRQKEVKENVEELKQSSGMKLWLIVQGFGMFKLGLLIASCGLAYRMSANA
jgi:hypothetical protein